MDRYYSMLCFRLWVATITISPLLFGCSPKRVDHNVESKLGQRQLSEMTDLDTEVFPLPNGNAYLISNIDQQLFLLSEDKAKRVDNVALLGVEATAYTLPNGAAYLVSSDGQNLRLYYLVGDKATLVQEGAIKGEALQRGDKSPDAYLWAQTQAALLAKRRAAASGGQMKPSDDEKPE